jgi:hypothetical protein
MNGGWNRGRAAAQAIEDKAVGTLGDFSTIPPPIAVLSDARHHLHFVSGAVEVLMAGASFHCGQ